MVKDGFVPPMTVNSDAKVINLNADQVDGKSSTDFYAADSKVADSQKLDGFDSVDFLHKSGYTVDVMTVGSTINGTASTSEKTCFYNATCPFGEVAVSGGYGELDNGTRFLASMPYGTSSSMVFSTGWHVSWVNNSTQDTLRIRLLCVRR